MKAVTELFEKIADRGLLVRKLSVAAVHVIPESQAENGERYEQMELFTDYEALQKEQDAEKAEREKEKKMQKAVLEIKRKFGKNAILRGMNLEEGATARDRNSQIGGHRA